MRSTLDRYAVYNPSFRLAESLLGAQGPSISSFDRYLRVNTGLTDVTIAPIDIELVPNLGAASVPPPPIFLFVIDSLRPDYLAPYNPAVRFTPRIAEFAAESVVFTNALTRYGGTGLSVPAIWAGSVIIHKQYVKPFHAMNTLEKLLDANRYRRIVGLDSIMGQLLQPSSDIDELDRGRQVMDYQFCRTLDELQSKLSSVPASSPVFAYSLPQDIHMSRLPRSIESGDEYRSFYAPYATKVHALDGCFGRFIDALKARRIYDDSLIVLTADHGEMLGEDGRFGHSYHLFPQTVQVPLIVHLPASVARRAAIDTDAVSLTTDITPTMYAALGYRPVAANDLTGRSLIDADDQHSTARRRDSFVIAASYGSVYAVARHNARRLYVADAVRGGDQAFERDASGQWHVVPVTSGLRAIAQFAIRHQIDELARMYHVDRN
jgi:membrane-anchored protein YejM (alkaline phosphatase superfamily)